MSGSKLVMGVLGVWLVGCSPGQARQDGAVPAPTGQAARAQTSGEATAGPGCLADHCQDSEAAPSAQDEGPRHVEGGPLELCSLSPRTGYFRDGYCRTGPSDRGVHVVCAQVTEDFLAYTRARGNDLSSPSPRSRFPGLKPGDRWCLCAARWEEARRENVAPPVVLKATADAALRVIQRADLQEASTL